MSAPIPTPPAQPAAPVTGQDPATQPPTPPTPQPAAQPGQAPAPPQQPYVPQPYQIPPQIPMPPVTQQPTGQDQGDGRDLSSLPQWAQQQIRDLRNESAQRRVAARTAQVNQHAFAAAGSLGANGHALLGSAAFQAAAQQLDPGAADFGQQLAAKVAELLAANPWMAAQQAAPTPPAPPAPPTSGAEFAGGNPAGAPITDAQLASMTPDQITEALATGQLKHLL